MREFGQGAGLLLRGFGWWRRRPGTMLLGLIPAAIVGLALGAALVALAIVLPGLVTTATPFAESWPAFWTIAVRVVLGVAAFAGSLVIAIVSFTALTLLIGEPFYDRIWRAVESDLGGSVPDAEYGLCRSIVDGLSLVGRGVLVALVAAAVGLIPVVGGGLGVTAGVVLTGWVLADELSSRALSARGIDRRGRRVLLRTHRLRALGFGTAIQLCFLVPLGAVVVMPAAVVGATLLARSLTGEETEPPATHA
ncbi:EI24 domain-containing protein [Microbacterium sp. BWT-B31]|uniref:EI24 domain-containing protein n=1 Tax=Microbacterium sp. BWT-B31 TaxID=3232072 RepID=UPI0035277EFE